MAEQSLLTVWNPITQRYESVEGGDGAVKVAAGDGSAVATEETLAEVESSTTTVASTVLTGLPTAEFPAVAVALKSAPTLSVEVVAGQTATATPDASAQGIVTRLAGITSDAVGESGTGLDVAAHQKGDWTVTLGPGDPGKPQYVQGVDGDGLPERLATQAAVDELEEDADATRVATESLDEKTLAPLGTAFDPARGTASNVASQLPDIATPRGFTLENIDDANYLYVDDSAGVTTAAGFRISPSRSRFYDLPNTNLLWVISASTTAWQIGAVL